MFRKGKEVVVGSSAQRYKAICVFGESRFENEGMYKEATNDLAKEKAARGINLAYRGGIQGLSGSVALIVAKGGSLVLGIRLQHSNNSNTFAYVIGTVWKVSSIHEQMWYMLQYAKAFIVLPGGLGTLEALFNIISWANMNIYKKPLGLLNVNGFYDDLLTFLDHAIEKGFMTLEARQLIMSASNAKQLINQMISMILELGLPMGQVDQNPQDRGGIDEPNTSLHL